MFRSAASSAIPWVRIPPLGHRPRELVEEMRHAADPAGEVEGQMRSHQRPAQPGSGADRGIDVGDAGHPFGDEMHRLAP
jgi:hypothetical protein